MTYDIMQAIYQRKTSHNAQKIIIINPDSILLDQIRTLIVICEDLVLLNPLNSEIEIFNTQNEIMIENLLCRKIFKNLLEVIMSSCNPPQKLISASCNPS